LPIADRPVVLVWAKRLWRCAEPACAVCTRSEESDEIAPRAVLPERARAEICQRVGPGEQSVARVARDFGLSWHAAMAAVHDHGRPRVDHLARPGAPRAVGLDETSFLAATVEHPTLFVTGIVDLDAGRLIDVLPARSVTAVTGWLAVKPAPWLAALPAVRHRGGQWPARTLNDRGACAVRDAIRFAKLAREPASPFRARPSRTWLRWTSEPHAAPTHHTAPRCFARRTTS
jgi:transposase